VIAIVARPQANTLVVATRHDAAVVARRHTRDAAGISAKLRSYAMRIRDRDFSKRHAEQVSLKRAQNRVM